MPKDSANRKPFIEMIIPKQENSSSTNSISTNEENIYNITNLGEDYDVYADTGRSMDTINIKTERVQTSYDESIFNVGPNLNKISEDLPPVAGTSRKRKHNNGGNEIEKVRKAELLDPTRITEIDFFLDSCRKFLSTEMCELVKIYLQIGSGENRRNEDCIYFALSLHYASPRMYRFLCSALRLPALTSLRNFVKPRGTKLHGRLFSLLKYKVDRMGAREKICSICIDSVRIKPNLFYDITNDRIIGLYEINGVQKPILAKFIFVVFIRGIVHDWEQPIGYGFFNDWQNNPDLNEWIDDIIISLINIGFDIRSFVTDTDLEVVTAATSRSVNAHTPYFEINGRKIYKLFDVPHLTKCVKTTLRKYDYYHDGKVVKWSYIEEMCTNDKTDEMRLAAQSLSNTVATAMRTFIDLKYIDAAAIDTVDFIEKLNKLFNILSSSKSRSLNTFQRPFCGDELQTMFLLNMHEFFQQLKVVSTDTGADVTKITNFIEPFKITINSTLLLFTDLQMEGIEYIYTKHLNRDITDNFFNSVRTASEDSNEPTCRQMHVAFRKLFTDHILNKPKTKKSKEDLTSLLMKLEQFKGDSQIWDSDDITAVIVDDVDYRHVDLPLKLSPKDTLFCIAAYLYRKCIEQHKRENTGVHEGDVQYGGTEQTPPKYFIESIATLEDKFRECFERKQQPTHIANSLLQDIEYCTYRVPCKCFPIEYLKRLYVRFKIYHTIRKNNRLIKSKSINNLTYQEKSPD